MGNTDTKMTSDGKGEGNMCGVCKKRPISYMPNACDCAIYCKACGTLCAKMLFVVMLLDFFLISDSFLSFCVDIGHYYYHHHFIYLFIVQSIHFQQ